MQACSAELARSHSSIRACEEAIRQHIEAGTQHEAVVVGKDEEVRVAREQQSALRVELALADDRTAELRRRMLLAGSRTADNRSGLPPYSSGCGVPHLEKVRVTRAGG